MAKINQEEYEILKKKQEKGHKYIAREKEGHVIVFTDYHGKSEYRWLVTINEDNLKYESLFNSSKVFQFIQWEDEEPYNIAELIEEYENSPEYVTYISNERTRILSNDLWSKLESEETEVKKNIEWLKSAIQQNLDFYNDNDEEWQMAKVRAYAKSLDLINQLDEPEVLSQKWISENVEYAYFDMLDGSGRLSSATAIIKPEKLQNLLVPKHDVPVVVSKEFYKIIKGEKVIGSSLLKVFTFYNLGDEEDQELFVKAWLAYPNIEIEQEPKYYVKDDKGNILLKKVTKGFGVYDRTGEVVHSSNVGERLDSRLTEQEIKDYDPRYWAFRKPVEEMEE